MFMSSFELAYEFTSEAGLHARARTVQVTVSMETKKSRPLFQNERDFLTGYLEG
jgi:acyl-CoA thioester hydrolase